MAALSDDQMCCVCHKIVAEPTGLEPATSDVTGRRSNQLNYDSACKLLIFQVALPAHTRNLW
jgi:cytochrome c2